MATMNTLTRWADIPKFESEEDELGTARRSVPPHLLQADDFRVEADRAVEVFDPVASVEKLEDHGGAGTLPWVA